MAVTSGGTTTAPLAVATSTSFSFVSNGSPLYVCVSFWEAGTSPLNSVTFNGVGLTRVVRSPLSNSQDRSEIWSLISPASLTANIVLTFGNTQASGSAVAFRTSGQNTTTPEGTAASNASSVAGTSTGNLSISPNT